MKAQILLFASLRDRAGQPSIEVEIPDGTTAAELRGHIEAQVPALAGTLDQVRIAIDQEFATGEASIPIGAEIALIPPVSGG